MFVHVYCPLIYNKRYFSRGYLSIDIWLLTKIVYIYLLCLRLYCLQRLENSYGLSWHQYSLVTVTALTWIHISFSSHIHTWVPQAEHRTGHKIYNDHETTFFFLNQQFITRRVEADRGSYFVTTYKRNRSTGGQKLKGIKEKKRKEKR